MKEVLTYEIRSIYYIKEFFYLTCLFSFSCIWDNWFIRLPSI